MEEVFEYLKKCKTYFLATTENGEPRVRPFGTVDIFEGRLYIQTGKIKDVSKQIEANPVVEICAWDGPTWIRVRGRLVRDERVEAKKHMLDNYPELRGMYNEEDDNTEVLYFEDVTAFFCSFTEPTRTVKF